MQLRSSLLLFLFPAMVIAQKPFDPVEDRADKPNVLILGDSISIGYTVPVRSQLKDQADVFRPHDNCGPTTKGIAKLEHWLGDRRWDVIHFNFGLHDLKYVNEKGDLVPVENGKTQVPLPQYEQNLRKIVDQLRATGAKLIWCSTTPVPEGARGRVVGDAEKYNVAAARVIRRALGEDAVVDDLFAFAKPQLSEIQQPANVHFTKVGRESLGGHVASVIASQLSPRSKPHQVKGRVYVDGNGNQQFDEGETMLAGVRVSNGSDIVKTDQEGRYELSIDDDEAIFVIKPSGYRTIIGNHQLPKFYYIHKPNGSPASQFPGVAPTGTLPESIDFLMYPQGEPEHFKAILFGDPQPRNQKEVDYITHDVIEELIGTDASFGVTLGDITFDDLSLFEPQAKAIAVLGIPWYNVIGNHDMNYDAKHDDHSDESFERVFGPSYYSFDYGKVHFMVLDDVEWMIDDKGEGRYQGGLGREQMEFIRNDLELIPDDQLVVLLMHIPLNDVRDRHELFRLIEQRPFCMSVSAHLHNHQHRFITKADGWRGPEPHHHVVNVTVSGSWWSGLKDERGIPHATMSDGAPNGYSIVEFDGHTYQFNFKAAGRPADYQIQIYAPEEVSAGASSVDVYANVFNGSEKTVTRYRIGEQGGWSTMERTQSEDPTFQHLFELENTIRQAMEKSQQNPPKDWVALSKPGKSTHLWKAQLPSQLPAGVHVINVQATDRTGRVVTGKRLIRVK